jgi:hypothetical protein
MGFAGLSGARPLRVLKGLVSPTGFSKGGTDALGFQIDVKVLATFRQDWF